MKAILIDLDRCIGCLACEIACKDENDLASGVRRLNVKPVDRGEHNRFYVPAFELDKRGMEGCTLCPQLQAEGRPPACVANCLTNALSFGEQEEIETKVEALRRKKVSTHYKRGEVIYSSRKEVGDWLIEH